MDINKLRLIEEVRKRPLLWDCQKFVKERRSKNFNEQWIEIGNILNAKAFECKLVWKRLRVQFCNEANRIPSRIRKAKQKGIFDPNRKYYTWYYFDEMRFVAQGRSSTAKFDINFENDSDVEIVEDDSVDQTQGHLEHDFNSNSFQTESDNDVEIVECDNLDQIQNEKQKHFETTTTYESDNDIEIAKLDHQQPQEQSYFMNNFVPIECDNTSQIIPLDECDDSKHENTNFRSYTVSLSNFAAEDDTILNDNNILQNQIDVKVEPELQIETDTEKFPIEIENGNEFLDNISSRASTPTLSRCSENSNLLVPSNKCEQAEQNISQEDAEHTASAPSGTDEDYCFLYSFLTPTKHMSQLQKMEFHANMNSLLLNIFPASSSVNILEKQLLLPVEHDPDRKFLISFWPFMKSMSLRENLKFRAKMSDLVFKLSAV